MRGPGKWTVGDSIEFLTRLIVRHERFVEIASEADKVVGVSCQSWAEKSQAMIDKIESAKSDLESTIQASAVRSFGTTLKKP